MSTKFELNLQELKDLHWSELGQSSFRGSLLALFQDLDCLFLKWADHFQAQDFMFPPFLESRQLGKIDYFKSFPHLLTVPLVLADDKENLEAFCDSPINTDGSLKLSRTLDAKQVLTPAACYHFYDELEGSNFETTQFLTTRCTCYRREKEYRALERQWAFNMREIVCLGAMQEVQNYLSEFEGLLLKYFQKHNFPVKLEYATDPFFNPSANPKYLMQKLEPVKKEMIYDDRLSIGSLNFHRNYFGEVFSLAHNGLPCYSACVAFGLERWMYMILKEQGNVASEWSF